MLPGGDSGDGSHTVGRSVAQDDDDPSCTDDLTPYVTQFMMQDRSNVNSPNILYQLPPLKANYYLWHGSSFHGYVQFSVIDGYLFTVRIS